MKESIGNALLFNLVITFVIIMLIFFIGSLSYSKAFKVKNKIIEEIEKNGETQGRQTTTLDTANAAYTNSKDEIEAWLRSGNNGQGIGYRVNTNQVNNCPKYKGQESETHYNNYEYCVYKISNCNNNSDKCGIYYHVTTYMYFDVPIISELIRIPVNGETRTFVIKNN